VPRADGRKVLQLEAQSEAIAELGTDDLQKKFSSLESSNEIDTESDEGAALEWFKTSPVAPDQSSATAKTLPR